MSTNEAVFYTYHETIAKKGAGGFASVFHHGCNNILEQTVRCLDIFCESCGGQNKHL